MGINRLALIQVNNPAGKHRFQPAPIYYDIAITLSPMKDSG